MPTSDILHPPPPHISIGLYSEHGERDLYARIYRSLMKRGADTDTRIGIAPQSTGFAMVSDLGDFYQEINLPLDRISAIANGNDCDYRPIRTGIRLGKVNISLGYDWSTQNDDHAVSLVMHAGPLGIPDHLQSPRGRKQARRAGREFISLSRSVCDDVDPLYATAGVEVSTPTPHTLKDQTLDTGGFFLSNRLLKRSSTLKNLLAAHFPKENTDTWNTGVFFSSWGQLNATGSSMQITKEGADEIKALLIRSAKF
ncbi:hypothetical protein SAMN05421505_1649 [Sinosporangium album]|uniref:Uncharacterized protein n=1 Tax=Sinosporangium album TaxID=504805 RepID=A0A1G8LC40_9ACTN|nr:hypothetical protein [Sinosporangium album]SDI53279.1 hypothetical protein SAMN05421505_1649 [Sinosporangium album]